MDLIGLAVTAVALIGIVALVFWMGFSRGRPGTADTGGRVIGVTMWVAAGWAAVSGISALVVAGVALWAPEVAITIPVQSFWPQLPPGTELEGTTATRTAGGFTTADVTLGGLSFAVRVGWAISQAVALLIPATIAALITGACAQLRAGRPFAPAIARMASVTAVVVALGGIVTQVVGDLAGTGAAEQLLRWTGGEYPDIPGVENALQAWLPQPGFMLTVPFWPIAAGLAFAALAAIFRYGSRLQRDTDGLV